MYDVIVDKYCVLSSYDPRGDNDLVPYVIKTLPKPI